MSFSVSSVKFPDSSQFFRQDLFSACLYVCVVETAPGDVADARGTSSQSPTHPDAPPRQGDCAA